MPRPKKQAFEMTLTYIKNHNRHTEIINGDPVSIRDLFKKKYMKKVLQNV